MEMYIWGYTCLKGWRGTLKQLDFRLPTVLPTYYSHQLSPATIFDVIPAFKYLTLASHYSSLHSVKTHYENYNQNIVPRVSSDTHSPEIPAIKKKTTNGKLSNIKRVRLCFSLHESYTSVFLFSKQFHINTNPVKQWVNVERWWKVARLALQH